jgi:hypothetical protein
MQLLIKTFSALFVFVFLVTFAASGQKSTVNKTEVARILKSLSSDDKMGRPAMNPAVMEKSISFIEAEFKRIGLTPLDGLKSFRQEFTQDMISLSHLSLTANGKPVVPGDVIVYSTRQQFDWKKPVNVERITKKDDLFRSFGKFSRDTADAIVLIDTSHAKGFNELKSYFAGKRILNPARKSGSRLFVLTSDTTLSAVSASVTQQMEKLVLTNVVGQLKAAKQTKESVIFSAHYDHLGIQKPIEGDSIANGADDDASGTTAVIMLADHFRKEKKLTRNLVFVAFTAEEIGGYGSKHFSSGITPADVVAMFNIEMIGKLSKWGAKAAFISGFERSDFGPILQSNLTGSGVTFHPDPYPEQNLFYRSDNATLARLGVPAHTISTDQIDSDKLYHTVNDEFESIDTENMAEIIRAIAVSASTLVTGEAKPTRIDTSKLE